MKRKAISIFTAVLMIALLMTSCGGSAVKIAGESAYISPEALPLAGVRLATEPDSLSVYKNIAFLLAGGEIERLDLLTGEKTAVLTDSDALAVGCDGSRIVTVSKSSVNVYDHDGERLKIISLDTEVADVADMAISGGGVAFSNRIGKSDSIYYIDLKTENVTLLSDTWKLGSRDASVQKLGLRADGTLLLSYGYNFGFAGNSFRYVEYDIGADEIMSQAETGVSAQNGCFGTDGDLYYLENYNAGIMLETSWCQFVSKISSDGALSNVMLVDNDGLKELGIEPQNIYERSYSDIGGDFKSVFVLDDYYLEYSDGESFVVWNQTAGTLAAFSSDTGLNALIILVPDAKSGFYMHSLKQITVKYTAKTGRQVVMMSYPSEEYADRLRTKLLAGDSDFDLFISDYELLRSILENSAYQPLDGYESLTANFDTVLAEGVRELMTADGGLFGVPMRINFWGCLAQTGDCDIPPYWTTSELFEFCDSIPDGKRVYGDRFMLTRTVFNYIEDMIYKDGSINKQELADFFGKLKEYNDLGVLCDGDRDPILTYGMAFFCAQNLVYTNNVKDQTMILAPTRSGTKYLELEHTVMMNRASENKDAAAEFLAMLTSAEVVYNNDIDLNILIGRDVERNSCYSGLTEAEAEALRYSMTMYQNAKPSKLDSVESLPQFIAYDVVERLFDGEITPDQASELVVDQVAYTYFE